MDHDEPATDRPNFLWSKKWIEAAFRRDPAATIADCAAIAFSAFSTTHPLPEDALNDFVTIRHFAKHPNCEGDFTFLHQSELVWIRMPYCMANRTASKLYYALHMLKVGEPNEAAAPCGEAVSVAAGESNWSRSPGLLLEKLALVPLECLRMAELESLLES